MKNFLSNLLKYSLIFGATGYLLYDAFTSINVEELDPGQTRWGYIVGTWHKADKLYLILCGVVAVLSHLIRAERWRVVLEPIGYRPSLLNSFQAVMNSYFINLFIPRGGEISRPLYLKKLDKIPVETGIGTVVTERIIDLIFLLICIATVFLFQITQFSDFLSEILSTDEANQTSGPSYKFYALIGLIVIGALGYFTFLFIKKSKPALYETLITKVKEVAVGLKDGLTSIFKLEKRILFIVYSLGIWVCYYLMLYFFMLAIPETAVLTLMDALTIFVVGGIAMALPMPGGTGTYHFLVPQALVLLCGLSNMNVAIAFATLNHAWITLIVILFGCYSLIYMNRKSKQLNNAAANPA